MLDPAEGPKNQNRGKRIGRPHSFRGFLHVYRVRARACVDVRDLMKVFRGCSGSDSTQMSKLSAGSDPDPAHIIVSLQ